MAWSRRKPNTSKKYDEKMGLHNQIELFEVSTPGIQMKTQQTIGWHASVVPQSHGIDQFVSAVVGDRLSDNSHGEKKIKLPYVFHYSCSSRTRNKAKSAFQKPYMGTPIRIQTGNIFAFSGYAYLCTN